VLALSSVCSAEKLGQHEIRTDAAGHIIPWSHDDPAAAYDHVIGLVWRYWRDLPPCPNGVAYPLQHQIVTDDHRARGIASDQISSALASWRMLYQYSGDEDLRANMVMLADHCLAHVLTPADGVLPHLPYPYNSEPHSGVYDGDYQAGIGFCQPDKAGAMGAELFELYRMTGEDRYLLAATRIGDTLAKAVQPGDARNSPWPFRVHAVTGEVPTFTKQSPPLTDGYTSDWGPTLRLFDRLIAQGAANAPAYAAARQKAIDWLRAEPLRTGRWGPYHDDMPVWLVAQDVVNAHLTAEYILLSRESWGPSWQDDAAQALRWAQSTLSHPRWSRYGVTPINEHTANLRPGANHTARHAAMELLFAQATGDWARKDAAIRRLNWATYMVDEQGRNVTLGGEVKLADGYGDYVRHYLAAMAACPELAPADQNHLLASTAVIRSIRYGADSIEYQRSDPAGREVLKLGAWIPGEITGGTMQWDPQARLLVVESSSATVTILKAP
jgi:hypothetical protein